jgi:hypothetical protein
MNEFYGNAQQSTETQDDFDLDIRLTAVETEASESIIIRPSRDSNCSTCTHTSPRLCC